MGRRLPSRAKIQHDYISLELTLAGDDNGSKAAGNANQIFTEETGHA
jgi:hypothetical protein